MTKLLGKGEFSDNFEIYCTVLFVLYSRLLLVVQLLRSLVFGEIADILSIRRDCMIQPLTFDIASNSSLIYYREITRYFLVILLLVDFSFLDFEFYKVHSELVLSLPT